MKLEKLTPAQEAAMKPFAQSWIDRLDKGAAVDKPEATRLIKKLYSSSGLREPEVLIVNSPLGAQFAAAFFKKQNVWQNVGQNVRQNVWQNAWQNVWQNVGQNVRQNVEQNVKQNVWQNVEQNVKQNVGQNVWQSVRQNVWQNVGQNVWQNVGQSVGQNVRQNVEQNVKQNVGQNAWQNVRQNVRQNVWQSVRQNVEQNVKQNVGNWEAEPFCSYGSFLQDAHWVSFYNFFETHCGLSFDVPRWADFRDLIKSNLCECIQLDGMAIGCEMPRYVKRDGQGRMHCVDGMAIEWADSYGLFCLWGVNFEAELFGKIRTRTILPTEVFGIKNIEQRMAALRVMGAEFVCDAVESREIDKSDRGNRLFATDKLGTGNTEYFLKYSCPSTKREYVSFVPPDVGEKKDADLAMAWKFGLEKSVYQSIELES